MFQIIFREIALQIYPLSAFLPVSVNTSLPLPQRNVPDYVSFFSVFFNTAKLLDGELCHMLFIIFDFPDEHIKIFNTSPVRPACGMIKLLQRNVLAAAGKCAGFGKTAGSDWQGAERSG